MPLLSSALWRGYIGNAPSDGNLEHLNPPIFRWVYMENPLLCGSPQVRSFRLQVSTNADFEPRLVDVVCSNNFYNFLPPITTADGSTYTGSNYWRVIYLDADASRVVSTGAVRSFRLAPDATRWDRSMLADARYLVERTGQHPHLYFRAEDRASVLRWCQTSQWSSAWISISNRAFQTITQRWWNTTAATGVYAWPELVAEVALVYQLTTNQTLRVADPMSAADAYARHWLSNNLDLAEPNPTKVNLLALMYDWLYTEMTSEQRGNLRFALESTCRFYLYAYWWYNGRADPGRVYPGPHSISRSSAALQGNSHEIRAAGTGLMCALSAMAESPFLREFFTYTMNYSIAQHGPYSEDSGPINQGRGYLLATLEWPRLGPSILAAITFPEAQLTLNPRWRAYTDYLMHMHPVSFSQINEPWGDLGSGRPSIWQSYAIRDLALFARSPEGWRHYLRAVENRDRYIGPPDLFSLLIPLHYPPPGEAEARTYFVNLDGGWAISASKPPNAYDAFTNGVGFITHARPRGSEVNHSEYTDGEVQMWAYGASITDGGVGSYRKHPMYHNALLVDGIGTCLPLTPMHDWYSRLTAWTNSTLFTYVAMDITRSFNRSNFSIQGYGLNPAFASFYRTNRVPHVSSVQRHVVFPRKKYWIMYDQFETSTNATFSWKWNVLEPTAEVDVVNGRFYYTATNHYHGRKVGVHVAHLVDPSALILTHLAGTNFARYNPITGEDYGVSDGDPNQRWNHTVWVSNREKATTWHFLAAIYPVRWDSLASPSIIRLDDNSVRVVNGAEDDTISFQKSGTNLVVVLELNDNEAAGAPVSPPRRLRVAGGSP